MLKTIVRRLSVNPVNRYRDYGKQPFNQLRHPRVCYLINDVNGRHPHFRRYPNPRIPSASILAKQSESNPRWRGSSTGGTREHFWRNKRRRKFAFEYENMPQRYEELCEFSIRLVEHDENMPRNYVRFHIPREMTKYELYNYLDRLYDVQMTHIELEAKLPQIYKSFNLDHPENRSAEYYKEHQFHEFSPNYYENQQLEGHGFQHGVNIQKITRETEGYSIAHCYLPIGKEFEFPDIFLRNETKDDFSSENLLDTILQGYHASKKGSETYRKMARLEEENTDSNLYLSSFQGASFFSGHRAVRSHNTLTAHHNPRDSISEELIPKDEEKIKNLTVDKLSGYHTELDKQKLEDLHKHHADVGNIVKEIAEEVSDNSLYLFQKYEIKGQDSYRNRYDENVTFTFTRSNAQKGQEPTFERNLNFEQFKSLLIESGDAAAKKAEADLPVDTKMEQ